MQIHWTKINKIIDEKSGVKTYLLDCPEDFTWEAGSFTHVGLEGFNSEEKPNKNLVRHMSISTVPEENSIGFTTRIREECSEFKSVLKTLDVGSEVAIFRTFVNIPIKRDNKNLYLLSQGVGIATFRPMVLEYLEHPEQIHHMHSLNVDSSRNFLFTDIFKSSGNFTAQFVDNRSEYYEMIAQLAEDKDGFFYVVGSDEFLMQNIKVLQELGVQADHIMLDKHEQTIPEFLEIS